jgi:hypothetical protein
MLFDALCRQTDVNVSALLDLIIAFIGINAKKDKQINETILFDGFIKKFFLKIHKINKQMTSYGYECQT